MLDAKYILENAEAVQANCKARGVDVDVMRFAELEAKRRELQQKVEQLNREANEKSKAIGKAPAEERAALAADAKETRARKEAAQGEVDALASELADLQRLIPNLTHPDTPVGEDDKANLELRKGKADKPEFDFKPLDHVELAEKHNLIDFEGGSSVAGQGFYYLKNEAVLLELALQQYAVDLLQGEGFTPTITPDLARTEVLQGVGFIPRGPETQIYSIAESDLNLIATAEITLGGLYAGKTIDADDLPIKLCGVSHCYRTEAGAAGRASRGLYRVHQFTKIEMFAFTANDLEASRSTLDELCALECRIFDELGIHYRVVDTATGDLGGPAYRKFDLEAWMPGRGEGGEYGEVTSTSNCTDYQARRLKIRYKAKGEKGTKFVHTLNGTAIACSRAMIAILENYQQADGSIVVPEVLRPYARIERIG
ncbi:MAG: serine--tRNA ligase [Pirellulales bacterium]|nr:serine--tRNA ligase [Pirellulales bacterium]